MSYPRWSQDGEWLAVNIKRGEDAHVGVVSAEGGSVEQLTSGEGVRWPYTFSPDGDRIAFGGGLQGESVWNIYSVSRRTKEVKQLTHFTTGGARYPAWSPRGHRIVFTRAERTGSLWTMKLPS
jgi:Tol biopolymer transport system component